MPSNETIELLENVLSSVSESDRAYYRIYDIYKNKLNDLNRQIANEEKKVEYYGKDNNKLFELKKEKDALRYKVAEHLPKYETVDNLKKGKRDYGNQGMGKYFKLHTAGLANTNELKLRTGIENRKLSDNEEALHKRIDKRTKAFDTTAKHEAALILIEALNTLLNE